MSLFACSFDDTFAGGQPDSTELAIQTYKILGAHFATYLPMPRCNLVGANEAFDLSNEILGAITPNQLWVNLFGILSDM